MAAIVSLANRGADYKLLVFKGQHKKIIKILK